MDKVRQYLYYFIIGIVSLISLVFLPMLGSEIGLDWNLPNTVTGWVVWIVTKLIVAVINVLLFHCFMQQAKINVQNDEGYKEANKILDRVQDEKVKRPRSPSSWTSQQYLKKGVTIFLCSALTAVSLTQAVLTFDYVSMLTYLFTIVMGIIFGFIQMKDAEQYWLSEYVRYAYWIEEKQSRKSTEEADVDNISEKSTTEQTQSIEGEENDNN